MTQSYGFLTDKSLLAPALKTIFRANKSRAWLFIHRQSMVKSLICLHVDIKYEKIG